MVDAEWYRALSQEEKDRLKEPARDKNGRTWSEKRDEIIIEFLGIG